MEDKKESENIKKKSKDIDKNDSKQSIDNNQKKQK